jgi:hypothetical protein
MNILTGYLYSARLRVGFKFLRREPRGGRPVHRSGRRNLQVDQDLPKQTDSIKVVYNDYSLYCTTVHNMQQVLPDDYKFDRFEQ